MTISIWQGTWVNHSSGLKSDVADIIEKYPFFALRVLIVVLLFIFLVITICLVKYRAYIHMVTDLDDITGLANWDRFKTEATMQIQKNQKSSNKKYALIQFDIDKFKMVNDVYGMSGGNRILHAIAMDIKALLHSGEMITRIYADVFCILMEYQEDEDIEERIEQFLEIIRGSSVSFGINAYFGVYKLEEEEELSIDMMTDRANLAKQSVKGNTVKYYGFFDQGIREKVLREKNIENNMYSALEAGEFVPYLQPQYSTRTEKIVSAEALVRWNDPIHQIISPAEFIELFERNKFIIKLDTYIWEQVCKLMSKWMKEGKDLIPISLNVSPVHFTNGDLVNEITSIMNSYHIPSYLIELEITESTFLEDKENVIRTIDKLHQLGYRIAMDDFGSGYSSLNLLSILPIDVLKIDQEFLRNTADSDKGKIVIKNVIAMAKELNMTVITEGVETREQVEFLRETECDKIQGYYYSKPLPVPDFENKYHT